jgi:hypothetical protein
MIQVADLEISNASLMAINRSLESESGVYHACCGLLEPVITVKSAGSDATCHDLRSL